MVETQAHTHTRTHTLTQTLTHAHTRTRGGRSGARPRASGGLLPRQEATGVIWQSAHARPSHFAVRSGRAGQTSRRLGAVFDGQNWVVESIAGGACGCVWAISVAKTAGGRAGGVCGCPIPIRTSLGYYCVFGPSSFAEHVHLSCFLYWHPPYRVQGSTSHTPYLFATAERGK